MPHDELSKLEGDVRKKLLYAFLKHGVRNEDDLRLFVYCVLGFHLPDKRVCHDHDSPMDFVIYDFFGPGGPCIVEACRDGYKTFGLAVANIAQLNLKFASILHLGAVQQQASNGDKYLGELCEQNDIRVGQGLVKRTTKETIFDTGARIQIAACTVKQANSPRVPVVRVDEADLADPNALSETKGIPSTDRHGNKPSWTLVSTRKFANGNMWREIEKVEEAKSGRFMRWCYKEVTERCPDSRSGTEPAVIYVDTNDLDWLTEGEFKTRRALEDDVLETGKVVSIMDAHYERFDVFKGCLECPIVATCRGDLKRAGGVRPIDDLIHLYPSWERGEWIAQKECRGVQMTGRIYRAFTPERCVPDDFPVWKSRKTQRPLGQIYFGKDWGYEHPDVTLVGQVVYGGCGHQHLWIHDELYLTHKDDEEVIQAMVARNWFKMDSTGRVKEWDPDDKVLYGRPRCFACDPTSPKGRKVYRKHGFLMPKHKTLVEDGIREVRKLIHPIHCRETHLHVHPRCKRLIKDMQRYSRTADAAGQPTEKPEKGGESAPDHGPDSLRVIVMEAFSRTAEWIKALRRPGDRK